MEQFLRCGFRAVRSWILGQHETKVLVTGTGRESRAWAHSCGIVGYVG